MLRHATESHDRPSDRRRNRRIEAPMTVVIGNTPYAVADWSLSGFKVMDYVGPLALDDRAPMRVLVPTAGPGALFRATGQVRRIDQAEPSLGMALDNLDTIAFDTLNRYFRERLVRGHA